MTKEEQDLLSPANVVDILQRGNADFVQSGLTVRNHTMRMASSVNGQYPFAVILSCIDSRVPVEDIFQTYLGDLFVIRIAGNVINEEILGSLEFSCDISGAKVIIVLGHTHCGAIKAAIDNVKIGHIATLVNKIRPAVNKAKVDFNKDSLTYHEKNAFVDQVCKYNIHESINQIRHNSEILDLMESKGDIQIHGAIYDLVTGKVSFLEK